MNSSGIIHQNKTAMSNHFIELSKRNTSGQTSLQIIKQTEEEEKEKEDALQKVRIDYNGSRIHSALGYLTPDEFTELWEMKT